MKELEKAKELIEQFMNDTTAESYRKGIVHAIYHVEEVIILVNDPEVRKYYFEVLEHLKEIKQL
jgi:hypothetical protein